MSQKKTALAIIPARSGSKRIPNKNIKKFCGLPIIEYSIKSALDSGVFDVVMVSTNSFEIADISAKAGAEVPFIRSSKNSDDQATIADVIIEVLTNYSNIGKKFDIVGQIFATAPLMSSATIKDAMKILLSHPESDSILSVKKFSFPIQRAMKIVDGKIKMIHPEYFNSRSQDLTEAFHDAAQFAFAHTKSFLRDQKFFCKNTIPYIISDMDAQDIDSQDDWDIAEFKYLYKKKCIKHLIG